MEQGRIIYVTYASSYERREKEFIEYVISYGHIPVNERWKNRKQVEWKVGEDLKEKAAKKMISISDELWVFGHITTRVWDRIENAITAHKQIRFFDAESGIIYEQKGDPQFEDEAASVNRLSEIKNYMESFCENDDFNEIERKWILTKVPAEFSLILRADAEQSYLSVNPEVRLRRRTDRGCEPTHFLDIKSDGSLVRKEVSIPISGMEYDAIREVSGKPVIKKDWHLFRLPDGRKMEVTVVDKGTENEFIYAEVEFPTKEEAENFAFPIGSAIEVTSDPIYKMKNYWLRTRVG